MNNKHIFVLLAVILLVLVTTTAGSLDHEEISHLKSFFKSESKGVKPEGKERVACWGIGTTAATTTAATTTTAAAGR